MIKITPYVKVFNDKGEQLHDRITRFTYKYSEENDDECILAIESDDPLISDNPSFQEGQKLSVEWGYLDTGESTSRIVYIFETRTEYGDNGVALSLTCHEKFAITKMNKANPGLGTNQTSKNDTQVLALGADVIEALQISVVTDKSQTSQKFLKELGIEFNTEGNKIQLTSSGWIDNKSSKAAGYQPNQNYGLTYNEGSQVTKDIDLRQGYPDMIYFNATSSTYKTLRKYLDKLPGGPFVIDSRDDNVTIRTRNYNQDPVRVYTYKGEDGELLSFTPESKNRQHARGSSKTSATSWDAKNKTGVKSTSSKTTGTSLADNFVENSFLQNIWRQYPASRPYDINKIINPEGKKVEQKKFKEVKGKPINYHSGNNVMDISNYPNKGSGPGDPKTKEVADRIGMSPTGGKAKPPKDWVPPTTVNDDGETVRYYEVYEMGGQKPARQRKGNGVFSAAQDGTALGNVGPSGTNGALSAGNKIWAYGLLYDEPAGVPETSKQMGNEGTDAANKAKGFASNSKANSQLDNNPASARTIGNPFLTVGTLITITNVSKKHSGNYYIKEVEHQIGEDGYMCTISNLTRQGTKKATKSIKVNTADEAADVFGIDNSQDTLIDNLSNTDVIVNNKIGPAKQTGFPVNNLAGSVSNLTIGPSANILQTIPSKEA